MESVIICNACGEEIPNHEKYKGMNTEDAECMSCEIKFWDSADIDNF